MTDCSMIYKICDSYEWDRAIESGEYAGSADDLRDGFIHLSTASQLPGTTAKHFANRDDLVVICFSSDMFDSNLKWEASRNGQLFPHLYGVLDPGLAVWVKPLERRDGAIDMAALGMGAAA